jgi:hypothetical protein
VLTQLGCDELQGFLFAKPMSARALLLWASDDRERVTAFKPSLFGQTRPMTPADAPRSCAARRRPFRSRPGRGLSASVGVRRDRAEQQVRHLSRRSSRTALGSLRPRPVP